MVENLTKLPSDIEEIFFKRLKTKIQDKEKLLNIFNLKSPELSAAIAYCNMLFRKLNNGIISYSKNVFIPLTTFCRNKCKYCNFRTDDMTRPFYITEDQVISIIKMAENKQCKEVLLTMGEKPEDVYSKAKEVLKKYGNFESTIEYLYYICDSILKNSNLLPHSNPGIMTFDELKLLREVNASLGLMLENISSRLMEPGGPHECSPGKNPELRIKTIENAGKLKIPFTTGILIGIGETNDEIIDSLIEIDKLNEKYNHIQEIIIQGYAPSKMRNKNENKLNSKQIYKAPSFIKLIKTIMIAKLITDIPIQTPPNLINSYQAILLVGIDDWGGISPLTHDFINPDYPWPDLEIIKYQTEEAGFILKERLPIYPKFIKDEYISERLREKIYKYTDKHGFIK